MATVAALSQSQSLLSLLSPSILACSAKSRVKSQPPPPKKKKKKFMAFAVTKTVALCRRVSSCRCNSERYTTLSQAQPLVA